VPPSLHCRSVNPAVCPCIASLSLHDPMTIAGPTSSSGDVVGPLAVPLACTKTSSLSVLEALAPLVGVLVL
jgi:hypothetical protein